MGPLVQRLTSRKFLLAVAAAVTAAANHQWPVFAGVVAAYLGVEGATDIRGAASPQPPEVPAADPPAAEYEGTGL